MLLWIVFQTKYMDFGKIGKLLLDPTVNPEDETYALVTNVMALFVTSYTVATEVYAYSQNHPIDSNFLFVGLSIAFKFFISGRKA
jgi:hypothetical protein